MGGTTKETNTTTSQSQATQQASQQGSQQATQQGTTPWAATSGLLGNLLNQIGGLSSNLTDAEIGRARPALGQCFRGQSLGFPDWQRGEHAACRGWFGPDADDQRRI